MSKRPAFDWIALAGLLLTLMVGAATLYGRFTALEARQDEADRDRHEMMANEQAMADQLARIESAVERLEQKGADPR